MIIRSCEKSLDSYSLSLDFQFLIQVHLFIKFFDLIIFILFDDFISFFNFSIQVFFNVDPYFLYFFIFRKLFRIARFQILIDSFLKYKKSNFKINLNLMVSQIRVFFPSNAFKVFGSVSFANLIFRIFWSMRSKLSAISFSFSSNTSEKNKNFSKFNQKNKINPFEI